MKNRKQILNSLVAISLLAGCSVSEPKIVQKEVKKLKVPESFKPKKGFFLVDENESLSAEFKGSLILWKKPDGTKESIQTMANILNESKKITGLEIAYTSKVKEDLAYFKLQEPIFADMKNSYQEYQNLEELLATELRKNDGSSEKSIQEIMTLKESYKLSSKKSYQALKIINDKRLILADELVEYEYQCQEGRLNTAGKIIASKLISSMFTGVNLKINETEETREITFYFEKGSYYQNLKVVYDKKTKKLLGDDQRNLEFNYSDTDGSFYWKFKLNEDPEKYGFQLYGLESAPKYNELKPDFFKDKIFVLELSPNIIKNIIEVYSGKLSLFDQDSSLTLQGTLSLSKALRKTPKTLDEDDDFLAVEGL